MSNKYFALFVLIALFIPTAAFAGGFCCQPGAALQDGSLGSISAGSGNLQMRLDYTYTRMSSFVKGDSYVSLAEVQADPRFAMMGVIPKVMDMHRITMSAAYSPTDRLRLSVSVPWVINDMSMLMNMGMGWMESDMDQISEIGDVTVLGAYRIYQDDEAPSTALSIGAGVKTPTGSSTVTEGGRRVHAHMQPGTGSWDPIFTAAFMKVLSPSFLTQADVTYHIATSNHLDYDFGDTVAVNAALKYNLASFVNLSFGLNYFHAEQADDPDNNYHGHEPNRLLDFVGYTGEDSIWISPGIQLFPFAGASMDFRFQYPVYYHVPDIEFVSDWRLTAGVTYSF